MAVHFRLTQLANLYQYLFVVVALVLFCCCCFVFEGVFVCKGVTG